MASFGSMLATTMNLNGAAFTGLVLDPGNNRAMVITLTQASGIATNATALTIGGISFTKLNAINFFEGVGYSRTELWYALEAALAVGMPVNPTALLVGTGASNTISAVNVKDVSQVPADWKHAVAGALNTGSIPLSVPSASGNLFMGAVTTTANSQTFTGACTPVETNIPGSVVLSTQSCKHFTGVGGPATVTSTLKCATTSSAEAQTAGIVVIPALSGGGVVGSPKYIPGKGMGIIVGPHLAHVPGYGIVVI